jgi:hypothetical protein
VAFAEEYGDLAEISTAYFLLAFVLMWRGDLDGAQSGYEAVLEVGRRIGDVADEVRALTYLAVLQRRRGAAEAVRRLAEEVLGLAVAADMRVYVGFAHGNLAWVEWRRGERQRAREQGEAAWEALQHELAAPFLWIGLWPLLAVRLAQADVRGGAELARHLIGRAQMKLPDDLEEPLASAVAASEAGDAAGAAGFLRTAVARAERSGWGWL